MPFKIILRSLVAAGAVAVVSSTASAGDDDSGQSYYAGLSCQQLWYERNAIFARNGYCFSSPRAIAAFGKGCKPPFGELPSNLKSVVQEIKQWEAYRGC